ncbi:hypothetical protein HDU99_001023, partial [Rhizoclosmatium hyalinum]
MSTGNSSSSTSNSRAVLDRLMANTRIRQTAASSTTPTNTQPTTFQTITPSTHTPSSQPSTPTSITSTGMPAAAMKRVFDTLEISPSTHEKLAKLGNLTTQEQIFGCLVILKREKEKTDTRIFEANWKPFIEKWFYAHLGKASLSSQDNFQSSNPDVFKSLNLTAFEVKNCNRECLEYLLNHPEVPTPAKPFSAAALAIAQYDISRQISSLKSSLKRVVGASKKFDLATAKKAIFKGTIALNWVKLDVDSSDFQTRLLVYASKDRRFKDDSKYWARFSALIAQVNAMEPTHRLQYNEAIAFALARDAAGEDVFNGSVAE